MVIRDEDGQPLVCGAWETNLLELIDYEEEERIFAEARASWAPDFVDYRVIRVDISREDVMRSFDSPVVRGEVQA
jgi:hypothetical protein